jgi:Tfp pilus assembly protein PilX
MEVPEKACQIRKSRRGVSLVETLISVIVLGVVVIAIMMAMLVTTRNAGVHKDDETARQLAMEVMDACEGVTFNTSAVDYTNEIQALSKTSGRFAATAECTDLGVEPTTPKITTHPPISADIKVTVVWDSTIGRGTFSINREVSVSGWQNVGDRSF